MKRAFLFLWLFACIISFTFAQGKNNDPQALIKTADDYSTNYFFKKAIPLYQQASTIFSERGDISKSNLTKLKVASGYLQLKMPEEASVIINRVIEASGNSSEVLFEAYSVKAIEYKDTKQWELLDQALDSAQKYNIEETEDKAAHLKVIRAQAEELKGEFSKALELFDECQGIYERLEMNAEEADMHLYMARLHLSHSDANKAFASLTKAEELHSKRTNGAKDFFIAKINVEKGQAYRHMRLFLNALGVLNEAADIARKLNPQSQELITALSHISSTHSLLQQPEKGIPSMKEAAQLSERTFGKNAFQTAVAYRSLGRTYLLDAAYNQTANALELSGQSYFKALDILETYFPNEYKYLSLVAYDLGVVNLYLGESDLGLTQMGQGVEIAMKIEEGFNRETAKMANDLANEYLILPEGEQLDSALKYYQKGLIANTLNFKSEDYSQNPKVSEALFPREFYISTMGKAYSMSSIYGQSSAQDLSLLNLAFESILVSDSIVSKLREAPFGYYNSVVVNSEIAETQHYGIRIGYQLYEMTGDEQYANLAYLFFEKSKTSQALFNLNSAQNLAIPEQYTLEEKSIAEEISSLETLIYDEKKSGSEADDVKLKEYEQGLVEANEKLRKHRERVKNDFPNYYSLKFDNAYLNIDQTQRELIKKGELLLNYNVFGSKIYSFKIDESGFEFTNHELDSNLVSNVERFTKMLKTPSISQQAVEEFKIYSDKLTRLLFPKSLDLKSYKNITIIPDGILHQLPFEVLLDPGVEQSASFDQFKYLIKDHDIKYATSATALAKQYGSHQNRQNEVLAIAPSFNENTLMAPEVYDSTRASMGNLAYTETEVGQIANHFNTVSLLDSSATEKAFRQSVSDYSVIHIASHGLLDESNSLYSKLLFAPFDTDSINDGYLNAREILELDINAEMVVLSACNTGSGNILFGEGVMSLANSFFYAGSKSLVMTLWTANDESTATLMDEFYRNLSVGKSKSQSLRDSKLAYLESADKLLSHPYYWAHFVVNGNNEPLIRASSNKKYFYVAGVLLIALLVYRKTRSSSTAAA